MTVEGLSPRRRGNRRRAGLLVHKPGSIPAQAGEPSVSLRFRMIKKVYPRAGGGTIVVNAGRTALEGLSPRRRGNRGAPPCRPGRGGSIPAQAGEPHGSRRPDRIHRVYPRAGGGTFPDDLEALLWTGLSPRRRGNPSRDERSSILCGSIPAQAGEPRDDDQDGHQARVYPRAGGGTGGGSRRGRRYRGLSPRRRGNRPLAGVVSESTGSIPAQAGEPYDGMEWIRGKEVYPRAGGGTRSARTFSPSPAGLSPRRRGNQLRGRFIEVAAGSIPAQAGEPEAALGAAEDTGVYPRAGGGTGDMFSMPRPNGGLSPRRRGNHPRLRPL